MEKPIELRQLSIEDFKSIIESVLDKKLSVLQVKQEKSNINLTILEVCKRLDISKSTFHKLVNTGRIRAYKVGGRTLIKETDLEESMREIKSNKYKRL